jgi:ATP-binding cassette, subfamily B, bacterial
LVSPALVVATAGVLVVQALPAPLQLVLSRLVLDRAALDLGHTVGADALAARLPLLAWILATAGVIALGQLLQPLSGNFQSAAGDRLAGAVTERLMLAVSRWQGLARFEDPALADDLERARKRGAQGGLELITYGTRSVLSVFTMVALLLVLFRLQPIIPALLILATLPQMVRHWEFAHRTRSWLYGQTPESRRLAYQRDAVLLPDLAKDVRLYGLARFFQGRYATLFDRSMAGLDRIRRRLMVEVSLASGLSALAAGAVYLYVVREVQFGQTTVGDVALYGGAATMLQARLLVLGFDLAFLPMVFGFLPSLFRILEAPPDLPVAPKPAPVPRPIRAGITFEGVSFTYPGSTRSVLREVSFSLAPAESLALVGHNGAGKTTIVKLLLRLYDPTAGRVLLDGVDLRDFDPEDLRREMAVIFQDFARYELTAGENIAMGQLDALDNRERLLAAARQAGADVLVTGLPAGLATLLGREFGGRDLSGGEWQKLALARAFVRDGQLLVLDEPTAALDVQTEHDVYTRFHDLTRDRMTVLTSHRFSTVRMADRILYLADGRIQEEGSHQELLAVNGAYARLYRLQAAQYGVTVEESAR